tara:strand:- start:1815 stop:2345 length:531 start_codon:yes stop_codon:yes gene_type:complete
MRLRNIVEKVMSQKPTEAMVRNFEKRTKEHIDRVAKNLHKLHEKTDWGDELLERAAVHDDSKYGKEEKEPYIWITEFYRCKNAGIDFEYPPGMKEKTDKASLHHITSNRHHPEYHSSPKEMSDIDIVEMVCDWTAMAQELGEGGGSAKGWADKNVNKKWQFSDDQVELIYDTIEQL